jgi:undecaprenyl-diphosphatase
LLILLLAFLLAGLLGGHQNALDVAAIEKLAAFRHGHPQITSLAIVLTGLGSIYATLGLTLLAAAWLAARMEGRAASLLVAIVIVERLTADGLKLVVDRARPNFDLHPVITNSSSFPSGHSANSMAAYVAIALVAVPQRWRRPALATAIGLGVLIGLTRIFLGVHWPSDVIGGWAWGLLLVGLGLAAGRRSGAVEAEHDIVGRHYPPARED